MTEKKSKRKRIIIIIIVAVLIALGIFVTNRITTRMRIVDDSAQNAASSFELEYTVRKMDIGDYFEIVGNVQAPVTEVKSFVSGRVTQLYCEEGDSISKGATIASVDDLEYRLNYLKAKSDYENALYDASKMIEQKEIQLEIAKRNLEYTVITSPVSGLIETISVAEMANVNSNGAVCSIVEDASMNVTGYIDEVDLKKIKEGQKVVFNFIPLGITAVGKVDKIGKVANSTGGLVVIPVEFSFNEDPREKGIIPGLSCNVQIVLMEKPGAVVIPINALRRDEEGAFVYVRSEKNDGGNEKLRVETGSMTDNMVEITDGLTEGQKIVITPSNDVLNTFSSGANSLRIGNMGNTGNVVRSRP